MNYDVSSRIRDALVGVIPDEMACAVTDPQRFDKSLMPSEVGAICNALPKRKTEFVAGRRAARRAMADLDVAPAPVPAGPDRAPIWPDGVIGSISHTDLVCVAVVAHETSARAIGVDVEAATPLEADLLSRICNEDEVARIAGPDQLTYAKLVFSAKEAAYKAQYPLTQTLIGFDGFDVTLDLEKHAFTATFTEDTGIFEAGMALQGKFAEAEGHFLSSVVIEHAG